MLAISPASNNVAHFGGCGVLYIFRSQRKGTDSMRSSGYGNNRPDRIDENKGLPICTQAFFFWPATSPPLLSVGHNGANTII